MGAYSLITDAEKRVPRVVVVGLASCFGCQLQITNDERHLTEVLGQIDLVYWQLVTSENLADDFDVAIIEGAVTTRESEQTCEFLRAHAKHVMVIGACACTGGIPGMALDGLEDGISEVYEGRAPDACGDMIDPRPVSSVIDVDSEVRCCPIDSRDFITALHRALFGSNHKPESRTMCADCKRNETECFFSQGTLCLGLVTQAACGARCVNLGRPCNGCAGLSPAANLEAARISCESYGIPVDEFDRALEMFNRVQLASGKE